MEKELVPKEQSLDLKELGFDEDCFGYYELQGKELVFRKIKNSIIYNWRDSFIKFSQCSAPTYQQAFRWFRYKYDLVHTVYSNASGYIWEIHYNQERGGTHICDSGESGDCEMSGMFTTYEKAELECLKKLIEIVKNGKK